MKKTYTIRLISPKDAAAALAVYAPYVRNTAISFEYDVPTVADFRKKIEKITAQYPWLVCECDGEIVGYVYGSTHRDRTAYQWSPEVTVYMSELHHRKGIARILYTALFDMLRMQGYYSVYAGVLSTNVKSIEFHKAMGFEEIGLFKNIGYKLGEWHTNLWMQHFLQKHLLNPAAPIFIQDIDDKDDLRTILNTANAALDNNMLSKGVSANTQL